MIGRILKAKHWQLFILTFGIPLIFQLVLMVSMISKIAVDFNPDPAEMFRFFKFFPLLMIAFMGVLWAWYWSVAIGLQNKLPETVKMKVKTFKIFFFIPIIYILLIGFFMSVIFSEVLYAESSPNLGLMFGSFALIVPLHLFSVFCIFYMMYFVAKTIKTVELGREADFGDFVGDFFLIWFFPVGVWFLQPKINKMLEESQKQ